MASRAGAGIVEAQPPSTERKSEDHIRVPLGTSALKERAYVEGREQTRGKKETPTQKKTLQAQTSKGGKGNTPLGCSGRTSLRREQCGVPPKSWNI
jgi:hypothetical protein